MSITLEKIELHNFKCFANHTVNFNETTIMIGENNAGKSTVIEALRILGLACARFASITTYINRPSWLSDIKPLSARGINLSAKAIDINLEQVFYRYEDPPAWILAVFSSRLQIEIYINSPTELFAVAIFKKEVLTSKAKVLETGVPFVHVLPQIVPLHKDEAFVTEKTLTQNRFSKRTSGNFRSDLYFNKTTREFAKFEEVIASTWHGIKVQSIEIDDESKMVLNLRDRDFVTEIYHMGHGVQMWLQTMWFIAKASEEAIVILDEPDVYMHADLQRRLIRLLKGQYVQAIIATHSIEIITEVNPDEILIINRFQEQSIIADSYPVVQTAISGLGSIHNINLSRILNTRKYLYVEGDDREILTVFWDTLFARTSEPLDHIAGTSTGGWGSWETQKNNAKGLMNALKGLSVYFLYDRDMHTMDEITERYVDAQKNGIQLHIWNYKEIDNYLIVPSAIARYINRKNGSFPINQLQTELTDIIDHQCEAMKEEVLFRLVQEAVNRTRHKKEFHTLFKEMKPIFEKAWTDIASKISVIDGSLLFGRLSQLCKEKYGVSFSRKQIASGMTKKEICEEIKRVLTAIHDGVAFIR